MKTLLLILIFTSGFIFAQETCDTPKEFLEELNTIDKCSIDKKIKHNIKETRQITVRTSDRSKRFLQRRTTLQNKIVLSKEEEHNSKKTK